MANRGATWCLDHMRAVRSRITDDQFEILHVSDDTRCQAVTFIRGRRHTREAWESNARQARLARDAVKAARMS